MAQRFVFKGEKPQRLNLNALVASVQAVAPDTQLTFRDGGNWERFPYTEENLPDGLTVEDIPEDRSEPWQEPDVLIFDNVPDQYTRQQVRNFILSHNPDISDDEDKAQRAGNNAIAQFLAHLQSASTEQREALKNAIANL